MGNKAVGLTLALVSGLFIGISFVIKKKGLLQAQNHSGAEAGQGFAYLKNWVWWTGMILMALGEICNFVAYAFTEAILVTPLGATSVVVSAVLSSIFLKERLSFVGKVGCALCVVGTVEIVLNAPEQESATTIQQVRKYVISPGFLSYAGVILLLCAFIAFWVGPRYGSRSMLVYISVCSLVGGISVVCTQGFGASVVSAIGGTPNQWNDWFLWVLFVFVVATLLVEIVYLNKALNIYNTSVVTPVYFTYFTPATIVSSAVLFKGFNGSPISIVTVVFGFLTIVGGVILLQFSLTASKVPDHAMLDSDLNDIKEMADREKESQDVLDPGPAAIRGASIVRTLTRRVSNAEREELRRRTSNATRPFDRAASTSFRSNSKSQHNPDRGYLDPYNANQNGSPEMEYNAQHQSYIPSSKPLNRLSSISENTVSTQRPVLSERTSDEDEYGRSLYNDDMGGPYSGPDRQTEQSASAGLDAHAHLGLRSVTSPSKMVRPLDTGANRSNERLTPPKFGADSRRVLGPRDAHTTYGSPPRMPQSQRFAPISLSDDHEKREVSGSVQERELGNRGRDITSGYYSREPQRATGRGRNGSFSNQMREGVGKQIRKKFSFGNIGHARELSEEEQVGLVLSGMDMPHSYPDDWNRSQEDLRNRHSGTDPDLPKWI